MSDPDDIQKELAIKARESADAFLDQLSLSSDERQFSEQLAVEILILAINQRFQCPACFDRKLPSQAAVGYVLQALSYQPDGPPRREWR